MITIGVLQGCKAWRCVLGVAVVGALTCHVVAGPPVDKLPTTRSEYCSLIASHTDFPVGAWLVSESRDSGSGLIVTQRAYVMYPNGDWEVLRGDSWTALDDAFKSPAPEGPQDYWIGFEDETVYMAFGGANQFGTEFLVEQIELPESWHQLIRGRQFAGIKGDMIRRLSPLVSLLGLRPQWQQVRCGSPDHFVLRAPSLQEGEALGFEVFESTDARPRGGAFTANYSKWVVEGLSYIQVESIGFFTFPGATSHDDQGKEYPMPASLTALRRGNLVMGFDGIRVPTSFESSHYRLSTSEVPPTGSTKETMDEFLKWASQLQTSSAVVSKTRFDLADFSNELPESLRSGPRPGAAVARYKHDGDSVSKGDYLGAEIVSSHGKSLPQDE